jgi:tRNA A-37 threonylcarbamoyl transferase component Bud32
MEDAGREDLSALASAHGVSDQHLASIVRLFSGLKAAGLIHGDTKASNFIVCEGRVLLVDLDALHEGMEQARDIARFLANWNTEPDLRQRFCQSFQDAGLPVPQ